jgi:hypothetical protein
MRAELLRSSVPLRDGVHMAKELQYQKLESVFDQTSHFRSFGDDGVEGILIAEKRLSTREIWDYA